MALIKRIGRFYTLLAVLCFNVLLFGMIGLLVLDAVLPPHQGGAVTGPSGINAVYSQWFNQASYRYVDADEARATGLEYDAWSANGHWQVHPWTGLISRPFDGVYLNINYDGIRASRAPDPAYAAYAPLRVWLFGGSTGFGWGLGDDWTIPSRLQVQLQSAISDRQVEVTNFAAPIYNSSQEVAYFIANLRLYDPPHAVLFLDGVNDVWFTMYNRTQTPMIDTLSAAWESQLAEFGDEADLPWFDVNPTFPLLRATGELQRATGDARVPLSANARYALQYVYLGEPDERMARLITTYRHNRLVARTVAEAYGTLPLFLLQPWQDQYYPDFRAGVMADDPDTVDISDTFDGVDTGTNPVLVDDIHYSDYGSQLVAQRIADLLLARRIPDAIPTRRVMANNAPLR